MEEESKYRILVERYSDMIYRIAKGYLRNTADAEDIVQEVLIKFVDNKKPFHSEEHERNWIIRVTINLCYNEIRSAKNRRNILTSELKCDRFYIPQENRLYDCISILEEKYRIVFEMYYLHDFKVKEISRLLKITEVTVRTRLRRARIQIKRLIKEGDWF